MLARLVARSKSRPDVSPGRALFVAAFIGFWMFLICGRLVYLQFSQYENLANRSPTTAERNRDEPATR